MHKRHWHVPEEPPKPDKVGTPKLPRSTHNYEDTYYTDSSKMESEISWLDNESISLLKIISYLNLTKSLLFYLYGRARCQN